MRLTLSVVIYDYNQEDISNMLESYSLALRAAKKDYNISQEILYVINNNQHIDFHDEIESICQRQGLSFFYINALKNGGYGHGNNLAIKKIDSDYHIISNPDIIFLEDTIKNALDYLECNSQSVMLTPAVFGKNDERHYLCKKNPTLFHLFLRRFVPESAKKLFFQRCLDSFEYKNYSYDNVIENVPFCTGCFMFFRTSILKKLEGFDERFFLYMEDADLSRRALEYGKTAYVPTVRVVHGWQRGAYKNKKLRNEAIKSAFKYWWKWGGLF